MSIIHLYTHIHANTYETWCTKLWLSVDELPVVSLPQMSLIIKASAPQKCWERHFQKREETMIFQRWADS